MNNERRLFIQMLADHIHGISTDPAEQEIDWNRFCQYAIDQSLMGIAYVQMKNFFQDNPEMSAKVIEKLHEGFLSDLYLYANRKAEVRVITQYFKETPIVLMKGIVVCDYYPVCELRSMGDIDFVIHTNYRQQTDKVMKSEGYRRMIDNHAVWTYDKQNIEFEIHDHMFYEYLSNDVDYRGYFDQQLWKHIEKCPNFESSNVFIPDINFHFLYLMAHLAKHITNKGIGFRSFLDLVFICQKEDGIMDWKWICTELEKLKLLDFTKTCFAFCEKWFDVKMPLKSFSIENGFYETVTDKIFNDGIFGLKNEQNIAARSAKEIKKSKLPYWMITACLTWKKLFPSYRDMQLVPWYKFVDGRPWLMPVAWVYRWFYTGTHKFKLSKDFLLEPFKKRKIIEKREQMIRDWGL